MKLMTVLDKRALIGSPIEGRFYRYLSFGGEFLLGAVRKKHISPSAVPRFNLRFEFVFLHCQFSNRAARGERRPDLAAVGGSKLAAPVIRRRSADKARLQSLCPDCRGRRSSTHKLRGARGPSCS